MSFMREKQKHNNKSKGANSKAGGTGEYLPFLKKNIRFLVHHFEHRHDYKSSSESAVLDPE